MSIEFNRFNEGARVQIVSLADSFTSTAIIGHRGTIMEVDELPNGEYNYDMRCDTCRSGHYMHECELEFSAITAFKRKTLRSHLRSAFQLLLGL